MGHYRNVFRLQGSMDGFVLQLINGIAKLRVANAESHALAHWARRFSEQKRASLLARRWAAGQHAVTGMFQPLALAAVYGVVYYSGAAGGPQPAMGLAAFLSFNAAFGQLAAAVHGLTIAFTTVVGVVPLLERVKPVLEERPELAGAGIDRARRHVRRAGLPPTGADVGISGVVPPLVQPAERGSVQPGEVGLVHRVDVGAGPQTGERDAGGRPSRRLSRDGTRLHLAAGADPHLATDDGTTPFGLGRPRPGHLHAARAARAARSASTSSPRPSGPRAVPPAPWRRARRGRTRQRHTEASSRPGTAAGPDVEPAAQPPGQARSDDGSTSRPTSPARTRPTPPPVGTVTTWR